MMENLFTGMPSADFIHENINVNGNDTIILDDLGQTLNKSTVELFNVLSHHMSGLIPFSVYDN